MGSSKNNSNKNIEISETSLNIKNENLNILKNIFPNFVKDGIVDFDAFKNLFQKENLLDEKLENEKFSLTWAGKSLAFKNLREPTSGTLALCSGGVGEKDSTENIFIEGDNLEVLKLLQRQYFNKIKMIYIDPPYNTGKDFVYKDNFNKGVADYYEITGQSKDGIKMTANTEKNGRFHSDWLTMMYPRLFLARNLLKDDGVIFVSIDDNEVANLRLIMDEIFGEENFVANIIWNSTKSVTNTALISVAHTHNLVYAKNINFWISNREEFRLPEKGKGFSNPDNDPRGPWKADPFQVGGWRPNQQYEIINPNTKKIYKPNSGNSWKNDFEKFQELLLDNRIVFGASGEAGPQRKRFLYEALERGLVSTTLWDDIETTTNGTQTLKDLLGGSYFTNPKPVELIKRFIQLSTKNNDDIILDFFAGSGTTAHAVMELNAEDGGNRKWICVQLPEATDEKSEAYKAGYKTISEITIERIKRAGEKIRKDLLEKNRDVNKLNNIDFGFKTFKLALSNYRKWNVMNKENTKEELLDQAKLFAEKPLIDDYKEINVVYEILLKEGYSLNSKVEKDGDIYIVREINKQEDEENNKIEERKIFISFAKKVKEEDVEKLKFGEDDMFVCFDNALDDTTKVNVGREVNLRVM